MKRKSPQEVGPQEVGPKYTETMMVNDLVREAHNFGWVVHHDRPAWTAKGYRTALQGDAGFPDLLLVRGDRLLFIELKSAKGKPTPAQEQWLAALSMVPSIETYLIFPEDLEIMYQILLRRPTSEEMSHLRSSETLGGLLHSETLI